MTSLYKLNVTISASSMEEALAAFKGVCSAGAEIVSIKKMEAVAATAAPVDTVRQMTAGDKLGRNLLTLWNRSDEDGDAFLAKCGLRNRTRADIIGGAGRLRTKEIEKIGRKLGVSPIALVTEGACDQAYVPAYPDSDVTLTEVVGLNLIDAMRRVCMSAQTLEALTGLHTIHEIETGTCKGIGLDQLEIAAKVLRTSVAELFRYQPSQLVKIELPEAEATAEAEPIPEPEQTSELEPEKKVAERSDVNAILADNIIKYRTWHRLSQREFADLVGTDPGTISPIERGLVGTTTSKLEAIAKGLKIAPNILLTDNLSGLQLSAAATEVYAGDLHQILAENVRKGKERWMLSVNALSKKANVAYNTICDIEKAAGRNVKLSTIARLAEALKLRAADLLTNEEE